MSLVQKILDTPQVYLINLPEKTQDAFIDVIFRAGDLYESDQEIGVAHLLEHYIENTIYWQLADKVHTSARVSGDNMTFGAEIERKKLASYFDKYLTLLFHPVFNDQRSFGFEQQSIVNEMRSKMGSFSNREYQFVYKERFAPTSRYGRSPYNEAETVTKLELADIEQFHQRYLGANNAIIFIGIHKPTRQELALIKNMVKNLPVTKAEPVDYPQEQYSGQKIILRPEKDISAQSYVSVTFPGLSYQNTTEQRIAMNVMSSLLVSDPVCGLFKEARQEGIYSVHYETTIKRNFGAVGFDSIVPPDRVVTVLSLLHKYIERYKKTPLPLARINRRFKNIRERNRKIVRYNSQIYSEIVTDILATNEFITYSQMNKALRLITPEFMRQLASKIYDYRAINIIISGEISNDITESKVKNIFGI